MKAAFAARVNLATQVEEVVNFSCWSRKSRIGTEAHGKLSACRASKGTSQRLNKVIRENSCVYLFVFSVFTSFSCEDQLGSQLAYF